MQVCMNQSKNNGVCDKHGAIVKMCSIKGCKSQSIKNSACSTHGAYDNDPLLYCTFLLCGYKTKKECSYKRHMKTHSEEYIKIN